MASVRSPSRYDAILANRARQRDFADLAEQRSLARREAAERTLSKSESTRNAMINTAADADLGMTRLTEMLIRTRISDAAKAEAKAKEKSNAARYI